ncbi:RIP metalloprotease RseP [cyanobacterium endosymbiont of Epithemia clementina EcSB]|uniref:RIP metalloprotease RseP n=1 Tax=cyanobacterium endosymbiont of Epithemia clementina EcSB TaxID=3034674 RepID=UPI002480B671|nr:RIP metalloprotease RseP [cyanobacterium endosymbiont of Epithemia clementina EcSB]WGT66938.1 RIP metalloprotease RseP [cyanobacterium endosymbiont of Epithemia clementina EcSB]
MSVLAAITVLALLIVVHELGHFAAARFQGIRVNRFSIGFGPSLVKYQGTETEYAIRAFPLGGYVGFPDDDLNSEIPLDDPNLLRNRPVFDRAIVISAGVIANLVLAYFLLVAQVATVGIQDIQSGLAVPTIEPASAAMEAGMKSGDIILKVNNTPLDDFPEATDFFIEKIQNSPNQPLHFTIERDDKTLSVTVTPKSNDQGQGKIGVGLIPNIHLKKSQGLFDAFAYSADAFQDLVTLTAKGFWQLVSNFQENAKQIAGPVKIVEYGANIAQNNAGNLFQFGALISINLAIINILPLPALDGGQLIFLMVEGLRGKPLPNRLQEGIMQTGLVLLLSLGLFLVVRDTVNLAFF